MATVFINEYPKAVEKAKASFKLGTILGMITAFFSSVNLRLDFFFLRKNRIWHIGIHQICQWLQLLRMNQTMVYAFLEHQLLVGTFFTIPAVFHDDDLVRAADGGQTMSDHDCSAIFGYTIEGCLHDPFSLNIDRTGRLIENENLGLADDTPRDGNSLALSSTQCDSTFTNSGRVTLEME